MIEDRMYRLLPTVHRLRDAESGYPLRTLLAAVAEQYAALDADIAQLYANWFIETCDADSVVHLARLLGVTLDPGRDDAAAGAELDRARVGNAVAERRHKGTLAAIDRLAGDITGWPVRVFECGRHASSVHSVRFAEARRARLIDVRRAEATGQVRSAFSLAARLPDVRAVDSHRTPGTGNVTSVLVSVWRLRADFATDVPALQVAPRRFTVDPLGADTHLAVVPIKRRPGADPVSDLDVPAPMHRLPVAATPADYIGADRSIAITIDGQPLPRSGLVIGNLAAWRFDGHPDRVCLDPVLGRIMLGARFNGGATREHGVRVSYACLGVGGIGGGHDRTPPSDRPNRRYEVGTSSGDYRSITEAIDAWAGDRAAETAGPAATIEILDNDVYCESPLLELYAGEHVTVCAAAGKRPVVIASDAESRICIRGHRDARPTQPEIAATHDVAALPTVCLDGLYVVQPVTVEDRVATATFTRCTLAAAAGTDRHEPAASMLIGSWTAEIVLDRCISGPLAIDHHQRGHDPTPITVCDSILDAGRPHRQVLRGRLDRPAFASLDLARCTVLGALRVSVIDVCTDSIVTGRVDVEYRQRGRIEFSYLPPQSRTPMRTHCQPDTALDELAEHTAGPLSDDDIAGVALELAPRFDSTRFGAADYGRLVPSVAPELATGAHDGGELGAFHDTWAVRRVDSLRRRLGEFVPPGVDITVRLET